MSSRRLRLFHRIVLRVALVALWTSTPLRAELVGWWTFDGDVEDHSGLENHGSLLLPFFEDDVPEVIGSGTSLRLEGAEGVEIAPDPSLDSERFTFSFWVLNRGQIAPFSRVASRGGDSFEIAIGSGGAGDELKTYAPANGWRSTFHISPLDTWQHVALVSDGVEIVAYADGAIVFGPAPLTAVPSGVLHLGFRHNRTEGFIGSIDDVALFSEPLTEDQILEIADIGTEEFLDTYEPGQLPPPPPAQIRAAAGDGRVVVGWDPVDDVDGYNVYRAEILGGAREQLNTELLTETEYVDGGVDNAVEYFYAMTSVNENGEGRESREISVTPVARIEDPEAVLVGWWPLDGDLLDPSGSANNGRSVLADPTFDDVVPDAIGGGQSLLLDGTSGFEVLADDPRLGSEIFTLSLFVRNTGQEALFERLTSRGNDSFETAIGTGAGGEDKLKYFGRPANVWTETAATAPFDEWMHMAYVATGAQITVYADGEVVHGPVPFAVSPSGVFRVGIRHNGTEGFRGSIDDVALFDVALSADDVEAIASSGTAGVVGEIDPGDRSPVPPRGLVATAGEGRISLDWDDVAGADGYTVYRAEVAGGPYETRTAALLPDSGYVDSEVESGVRYYYVVTASNRDGESMKSGEVFATPNVSLDRFVRGDVDGSGSINLSDGINLLLFQFQGGAPPACGDAADTDDSGSYNLTDAIVVFQWLFLGGDAPREPMPSAARYTAADCGVDPTDDDPFDCEGRGAACSG